MPFFKRKQKDESNDKFTGTNLTNEEAEETIRTINDFQSSAEFKKYHNLSAKEKRQSQTVANAISMLLDQKGYPAEYGDRVIIHALSVVQRTTMIHAKRTGV